MTLNDQLYSLYTEAWKQLEDLSLPTDGTLSMPFFIKPPEGYEDAKIRLVVVGQQTRGWGRHSWGECLPGDPIKWLQTEYEGALKNSQTGHFWKAVRRLQEILASDVPPNGLVWANFFPMDQNLRIPDLEVQKKLVELRVLDREMKILNPDVVVLFIGPSYRVGLNLMFPDVPATPHPRRESPIVAIEVGDSSLPRRSYWTYHPRSLYYQGKGALNNTLDRLAALIRIQEG